MSEQARKCWNFVFFSTSSTRHGVALFISCAYNDFMGQKSFQDRVMEIVQACTTLVERVRGSLLYQFFFQEWKGRRQFKQSCQVVKRIVNWIARLLLFVTSDSHVHMSQGDFLFSLCNVRSYSLVADATQNWHSCRGWLDVAVSDRIQDWNVNVSWFGIFAVTCQSVQDILRRSSAWFFRVVGKFLRSSSNAVWQSIHWWHSIFRNWRGRCGDEANVERKNVMTVSVRRSCATDRAG